MAYTSFESGQPEIIVAAFPGFTDRRQISTGDIGAVQPLWRADGQELFFLGRNAKLMAVDVMAGATLETGPVRELFQAVVNPSAVLQIYAATRDGKRFIVREQDRRRRSCGTALRGHELDVAGTKLGSQEDT